MAPRTTPKPHAPPSTPSKHHNNHHKKASKSPVYILASIVLISLILLITFSVILRVTSPNLHLTITSLQHFNVTSSSSPLNVTMSTELTISNRNYGPYSYEKCKGVIFHNDVMIGGGDVIGGRVGARSRKAVSVSMSFESNESNETELVEIFVFVKMSGRVRVLKIRNRAKTVEMNCTVRIDVTRRFVTSSLC
ncbi:hypothetical protein CTI12_AA352470 [Artemisia annua]|uniref:Late embryogenesis abundant protein, LEA-14 n=1 Tax=Artemisia annua TaxID=35608 RepID=A0A2U1MQD1_ARTAN|nr:hypothetical protein CTI12_AA352470 [Artemisia annua]